MKICMIVPHFFPFVGGAENLFMDFARNIVKSGNEVRVVTSSVDGKNDYTNINGVHVYYYNWKMIFGHPLPKKSDIKQHVEWCDMIHTAPFTVATVASNLGKQYDKPVVFTVHEVLGTKWHWIEENWVKAELFRSYEKFICTRHYRMYHFYSKSTQKDFFEYCGHPKNYKMFYLSVKQVKYNNNELKRGGVCNLFNINKNEKVFLYYGRPGQSKGIFIYAEAIRILKKKDPDQLKNVKFCFLMSDNPMKQKEKFLKYIDDNMLKDYVIVHSSVEREMLLEVINDADYVVVPSITEGFGLSAVEACNMGKCILYSSGGSLPEVVFGKCLEFENRNSSDLAEKILKIIVHKEDAFDVIPKKKFDEETMAKGLISMYQSIYKGE